jgi:hypothetical protein
VGQGVLDAQLGSPLVEAHAMARERPCRQQW